MKKLVFVALGAGSLALSACSSNNEDAVNNADVNQAPAENLDNLASDAANDTANAEADALANQQAQLENATEADNTANPSDAEEQNVSGM